MYINYCDEWVIEDKDYELIIFPDITNGKMVIAYIKHINKENT